MRLRNILWKFYVSWITMACFPKAKPGFARCSEGSKRKWFFVVPTLFRNSSHQDRYIPVLEKFEIRFFWKHHRWKQEMLSDKYKLARKSKCREKFFTLPFDYEQTGTNCSASYFSYYKSALILLSFYVISYYSFWNL